MGRRRKGGRQGKIVVRVERERSTLKDYVVGCLFAVVIVVIAYLLVKDPVMQIVYSLIQRIRVISGR